MTMLQQTFKIPILKGYDKSLHSPDTLPDRWIAVPARNAGVPGLVITALYGRSGGVVSDRWVLTHRDTGRSLGSRKFESIAAARRAAKAIADEMDWSDTTAVWDAVQDKPLMDRVNAAMKVEGLL